MAIIARMTQVATLVGDLAAVDAEVRDLFGFEEGYHERGMAMFGLTNTVQRIGERQYLEVCGRIPSDDPAHARVGGRRGNGGYMAIVEVADHEDIETCRKRLEAQGLRVVHEIQNDLYHSIHVHPRDLGTIVSFDWNIGSWPGISADWDKPVRSDIVSSMCGIELRSSTPEVYADRWAAVLGIPIVDGAMTLTGDGFEIRFAGGRPDGEAGLDVIDFKMADRSRAGVSRDVGGTEFRFV